MRKRLLFVIQTYPDGGGISSILENYVAALDGVYEVHVAIVEERPGRAQRLRLSEHRIHRLGYSNLRNPLLFPTSLAHASVVGARLRRVVKSVRPDLVIAKDALHLPVPTLFATSRRTPLAIVDHGTLTNVHEAGFAAMIADRLPPLRRMAFRVGFALDLPWRALRWRLAVALADHVWFTGDELRPWFARAGQRAQEYTQTVPSDFVPPTLEQRANARSEFGINGDERVFNVVGRLDGEKGLDTIIDAVREVRQVRRPFKVLIVGDGSLNEWTRDQVTQQGLSDVVLFLGRLGREGVRRVQHASDFHIYAGTVSCGVSICLLEAMAAGVIPIASDVPSAQRDIIGSAGWVFPAGNAEQLCQCIQQVLALPKAELDRLRAASRTQVLKKPCPTFPELVSMVVEPKNDQPRGM